MENAALNALYARAEIFNKFEELSSQLNPEEAEIASHYLENLIKTRPVRAQLSVCPESEQVSDTNCEFCAAGVPRQKDSFGYYHEVAEPGKDSSKYWIGYDCGPQIPTETC